MAEILEDGMMVGNKAVFAVVIISLMAGSAFADRYGGGTGEPNNPYRIETPNDLNEIGNHPEDFNDCFILVSDINMAGFTYTTAVIAPDTSSSSGFQGTPFSGLFDGNDCNICNLTIDTGGRNDYLGLFGRIKETGQVKNLGIEDVNITGGYVSDCLGGLCGYNDEGTISNCHSRGSVSGGRGSGLIGGLCGMNDKGTISDCYAACSVSGTFLLGSLCGINYGTIRNCHATGSVTCGGTSRCCWIGGLCGSNQSGSISNCYSTGSVTGGVDSRWLGGLCGQNNEGTISNCYATGSVSAGDGSEALGGLCGGNYKAMISNCYATGSVSGGYYSHELGGLCGDNWFDTISNCYATGSVTGGDYSHELGGLCGFNEYGTISDCYATGYVSGGDGSERLGGLCGDNYFCSTISNCYSTGSVTGGVDSRWLGGLCGQNNEGTISNCYATGSVSAGDNSEALGGLCGDNDYGTISNCYFLHPNDGGGPDNGFGTPLIEELMKQQNSFSDWDFVEVWDIGENQTYPFLRIYAAGDLNHDGRVDFFDFAIITEHWLEEK